MEVNCKAEGASELLPDVAVPMPKGTLITKRLPMKVKSWDFGARLSGLESQLSPSPAATAEKSLNLSLH